MTYAKYISETRINPDIPTRADIAGMHYSGDLTKKPEVLKALGFLPVWDSGEPIYIPENSHYEPRYKLVNDESERPEVSEDVLLPEEYPFIAVSYVILEDPKPIFQYSKLKILMMCQQAGLSEKLLGFLKSDEITYQIWLASNVIETNELFYQYIDKIVDVIGKPADEIIAMLNEYCLVD